MSQVCIRRNTIGSVLALFFLVPSYTLVAQIPDPGNQGVTIQLPVLGVSVDAAGVLAARAFTDPGGQLMAAKRQLAGHQLAGDIGKRSPMRKVSLRRLENAIEARIADQKPLEEEIRFLAGLQRLEYVLANDQ